MRAIGHLDTSIAGADLQAQKDALLAEAKRRGLRYVSCHLSSPDEPYSPDALYQRVHSSDACVIITYSLDHVGGKPDKLTEFAELVTAVDQKSWEWIRLRPSKGWAT